MTRFFRISSDGAIVGISEMSEAVARINLGPGETLLPWQDGVSPERNRWDGERFVAREPAPTLQDDYAFMRSTGYPSVGDQLGAVMKLLANPSDTEARVEFEQVLAQIEAVKKAHPKNQL